PGLDDLIGFGRREMHIDATSLYHSVIYQLGAAEAFARLNNNRLNHVKPHGALFNMASKDKELAHAIAEAVYHFDPNLILVGLAGGELIQMGKKVGLKVASEVFSDRTYQPDGSLTSRMSDHAMISDSDVAVSRVIRMVKEGKVEAVDGSDIAIEADTICVHGDEPTSLEFVRKLSEGMEQEGIKIKRVGS